jgi:hypothetical protein
LTKSLGNLWLSQSDTWNSPSHQYWVILLGVKVWTLDMLAATKVSWLPGPIRSQSKVLPISAYTYLYVSHLNTHFHILLYVTTSICMKLNVNSCWCVHLQTTTIKILLASCLAYPQSHTKLSAIVYLIFCFTICVVMVNFTCQVEGNIGCTGS